MRETFYYIEVKRKTEARWELHYANIRSKTRCLKFLKTCRKAAASLPYEFRMVMEITSSKRILKY